MIVKVYLLDLGVLKGEFLCVLELYIQCWKLSVQSSF